MKKIFLLLFTTLTLYAEASYKKEIEHLLNYVKTTPCTYIRHGVSYNGEKAVAHIRRKYNYFRDDIHSTEDFIRLSATQSTMFGTKYHIKCPNQEEVESGQWLLEELARYREKNTTYILAR